MNGVLSFCGEIAGWSGAAAVPGDWWSCVPNRLLSSGLFLTAWTASLAALRTASMTDWSVLTRPLSQLVQAPTDPPPQKTSLYPYFVIHLQTSLYPYFVILWFRYKGNPLSPNNLPIIPIKQQLYEEKMKKQLHNKLDLSVMCRINDIARGPEESDAVWDDDTDSEDSDIDMWARQEVWWFSVIPGIILVCYTCNFLKLW